MGTSQQPAVRRGEYMTVFAASLLMVACWALSPVPTRGLLNNTIHLGLTVLAVSAPIAGALAWSLIRCDIPGRRFWEACLLVLLFIPLYIQLAAWEAGFGRGGWYSTTIAKTLTNPPMEGYRGAVWVHAVAAIPWLFWIFRLALMTIPRVWEEAAMLDASPWHVFTRITMPLTAPAMLAGVVYVLIVCATEITVTDRYQYRSYAEVLYSEFVLGSDFQKLPLGVWPIMALMLGVLICGLMLCRVALPRLVQATASHRTIRRQRSRIASGFVPTVLILLFFLPIGNLVYQAGIEVYAAGDARIRSWSPVKLLSIVAGSPYRYRAELAWTAILVQLSSFASIAVAILAGWWGRRHPWRLTTNAVVATICFVVPGPILGIAIIAAMNGPTDSFRGWLYADTIFAPWLALFIRSLPFAYLLVIYGLNAIPETIYEAAESDGAGWWTSLRFVALPMLWPYLSCAVFVCLAVGAAELSASVMVMPPGMTTVASEIFNLIHYGAEDQLAGLCLACLLLMAVISLLARSALFRLVNKPEKT